MDFLRFQCAARKQLARDIHQTAAGAGHFNRVGERRNRLGSQGGVRQGESTLDQSLAGGDPDAGGWIPNAPGRLAVENVVGPAIPEIPVIEDRVDDRGRIAVGGLAKALPLAVKGAFGRGTAVIARGFRSARQAEEVLSETPGRTHDVIGGETHGRGFVSRILKPEEGEIAGPHPVVRSGSLPGGRRFKGRALRSILVILPWIDLVAGAAVRAGMEVTTPAGDAIAAGRDVPEQCFAQDSCPLTIHHDRIFPPPKALDPRRAHPLQGFRQLSPGLGQG